MGATPESVNIVPATAETIRQAAQLVAAGELVIIPTETVYGVAARGDSPEALARLCMAKERQEKKKLALLAADLEAIRAAGARVDAVVERLAAAFWPGPLTLVLPTAAGEWVGYRVPDHPVALAWLRELDFLPAVTSANRSGEPAALTAADAWRALSPHVALALDAGVATGGRASTVVKVADGKLEILRAGPISSEALERAAAD